MREYQPIGCRDEYTTNLLAKAGIDVFFNYCLSLMFDKREKEPKDGKIIFCDAFNYLNTPSIFKGENIYRLWHYADPSKPPQYKMKRAQELLDIYKYEAKLVITSRLHCALPCIAMGIPVILSSPYEHHRFDLAKEFIPLYELNIRNSHWPHAQFIHKVISYLYRKIGQPLHNYNKINWNSQPLDIEHIKDKILAATKEQIRVFTT